jgi:predicted phage baseplate assembly protein
MSAEPNCPCDVFVHPEPLFNPPGRDAIAYRGAGFPGFRRALLRPLPGEHALAGWTPSGEGDLAVQIAEWYAYVADILTFYNERIANETYLRTALLPESLARLVRLLGYRPRPGIGATGTVGALLRRPIATTLPAGLQLQSKPPPGKQPQTFEIDASTIASAPDAVPIAAPPDDRLVTIVDGVPSILLRGASVRVREGDRLLLLPRGWSGGAGWALATAKSVARVADAGGGPATRIALMSGPGVPATATATGYRLLGRPQAARVWQFTTAANVALQASLAHLDALHREIRTGDPVLFEAAGASNPPSPALVRATGTSEQVWYANAESAQHPENTPPSSKVPIPILHTQVDFSPSLTGWTGLAATASLSVAWSDVGTPIATPATTFPVADPVLVTAVAPARFPNVGSGVTVTLEDALGFGATALASPGSGPGSLSLSGFSPKPAGLRPPFRLLFDLVSVSRGTTVPAEVLGSGDAAVAGQELVLKKAPLTYLPGDSASGAGYRSTLRVRVDGIEWSEVPSFYGRPADARIFVTREDEEAKTHVLFGDGINGARLPSGAANVTASYRVGSGGDAPPAGSLTTIATPFQNLQAVRNPVAVGGGADPDQPEQIRRLAPRSVLTFGRAVSAADYETIAAQAPGVSRARSYWAWDAIAQRALVTIYAGDDQAAVTAAQAALRLAEDPNRHVLVQLASPVPLRLKLTVVIAADRAPGPVLAAVRAALADPAAGILGTGATRIGRPLFVSRIDAACVDCAGVLAVHGIAISANRGSGFVVQSGFRVDPGAGGYFALAASDLTVSGGT